ncbi:DUF397 domain-containing protein [Streptomyces sp. NPDC002054]|uniref:DUF397 domain-containing protein n=1 Tax=Streptomyces sp. NPDC002054 TaxID=3154663 RepID=UPI00332C1963
MNSSQLRWFKSSYSSGDGDNCVEVALSWHKSSYSSGDGDCCVEVAACADTVHVRDSKLTASPELALSPAAWARFLSHTA